MVTRVTRFYVDVTGAYLGGWQEPSRPPAGAIEVPSAPDHAAQVWNGAAWGPVAAVPLESTPLTPEDVERLLLQVPGITRARIDQAKKDRGEPLP